jgi:beta-glucosidase
MAGDIDDAELPIEQVQEVARVAAAVHQAKGKGGAPVVGVLLEGRPRILQGIPDMTQAFVHAMLPGPAGGRAIADVLLGLVVRLCDSFIIAGRLMVR